MDYAYRLSIILSAVITLILTILFGVMAAVIKIQPKETYSVIRINLDEIKPEENFRDLQPAEKTVEKAAEPVPEEMPAEPVVEKAAVEESPAPAPAPAPKAEKKTETVKKTEAKAESKPKAETKPASTPAATTPKAAETPVTQTYAKTQEQLMAEQAANKKQAVWNDDLFADMDDEADPSASVSNAKAAASSSISGTAGTSAASENNDSSAKSSNSGKTTEGAISRDTLDRLATVEKTYTSSSSKVNSSAEITAKSYNGKVLIQLSDDKYREMLYPAEPVITLSEEAASAVDSDKNVRIKFRILANGTVPLGDIIIEPASVLTSAIQMEIRKQISGWKFAADTTDGTAIMDYTIRVK